MRTIWVGGAYVVHLWPVVRCVRAPAGPVYILIAYHEIPRLHVRLETACRAGTDEKAHAEGVQRPDIRTIVNPMRRKCVITAVPSEKCHAPAVQVANQYLITGL